MAVNGYYLTASFSHAHLNFLSLLSPADRKAPPPLHLTVLRRTSEYIKLRPMKTGLGFHIKGSSPVIIHGVDKGTSPHV